MCWQRCQTPDPPTLTWFNTWVASRSPSPISVAVVIAVRQPSSEQRRRLKSATASSVTKPAKMETGLMVQVPAFINEGEKIRVDTSEGTYMSRA